MLDTGKKVLRHTFFRQKNVRQENKTIKSFWLLFFCLTFFSFGINRLSVSSENMVDVNAGY